MHKKNYPHLDEVVYEKTLENGLQVVLVPKPGFQKVYGLFSTRYGSIDETFIPLGKTEKITVPEGIAHFLEHKLFEKEDGDVFQKFSQMGASANAFTSFTKTSYLFSATEKIEENLETLIDFVQAPYFTKETVDKEKGIIAQEIQMYQDEPQWRLFFGILQNLYPKHPLHIDIAGTVESIQEITAEDLYTCYETFYHPSNMTLLVVGNIQPEEMMTFIEKNQARKDFPQGKKIQRFYPVETPDDLIKESTLEMDVTMPKLALGIKGFDAVPQNGLAQLRYKLIGNLLLELVLGDSSKAYLDLYDEGLIDDSFGYEFSVENSFHFADFSGDTQDPKALLKALRELLFTEKIQMELTEENLIRLKKKRLGKYLQSLNSVEYIANQFFQGPQKEGNLYDIPTLLEEIKIEELKDFASQFFKENHQTVVTMFPSHEGK